MLRILKTNRIFNKGIFCCICKEKIEEYYITNIAYIDFRHYHSWCIPNYIRKSIHY
jgi:hypothetical protein